MADQTLTDVVERLRDEGQLTRNSGTNSLKALKEAVQNGATLVGRDLRDLNYIQGLTLGRLDTLVEAMTGDALAALEEQRENAKRLQKQEDLLEEIADNTEPRPDKTDEETGSAAGLILGGLAAALGLATGAVLGWLNAVRFVTSPFFKLGTTLLQFGANLVRGLGSFIGRVTGISRLWSVVTTSIINMASRIYAVADTVIDSIRQAFNFIKGSSGGKIGAIFTRIGTYIDELFAIFGRAASIVKGMLGTGGKMTATFGRIASRFSILGKIFGVFKTLASKIFFPISLIIASFEAVTASLDQFIEGDFIGGFETLITEFFDSLIFAPLDMLKGAVAWVLEKFGFTNAAEALGQFSFSEIWSSLVSGIFGFFKSTVEWIKLLFSDPVAALQALWDGLVSGAASFGAWIGGIFTSAWNWITGIFNLEGLGEMGLNLVDWAMSIPARIYQWFTNGFNSMIEGLPSFGDIISGGIDIADQFIRSVLRMILPTPDDNAPWYDVGALVSKAIPSSVYEYAGLNPYTGDALDTAESIQAAVAAEQISPETGAQMLQQIQDLNDALENARANERAAATAAGNSASQPMKIEITGGNQSQVSIGGTALPDRVGGPMQFANPAMR